MPYAKRLIVPSLLILAGASVPVALGAATLDVDEGPKEFELGKLGKHRLIENSLIFDYRGDIFVLRYEEWPVKEKLGMVSFEGSIIAAPLREELLRIQKQRAIAAAAADATTIPAQAPPTAPADVPAAAATKR